LNLISPDNYKSFDELNFLVSPLLFKRGAGGGKELVRELGLPIQLYKDISVINHPFT
jgi:hypothetical protein